MRIGLRIFLGYFLIVGLAGFFVMRVFVNEVKPGVRQAMEATLVDTSMALAALAAPELQDGQLAHGRFAAAVDGLARQAVDADIAGVTKRSFDYRVTVTDARGIVVYDSAHRDVGRDNSRWNDVARTLRGEYGARSTRTDPDDDASSVMHVAAPVLHDGQRIGVLTVAKANIAMQPFIAASQRTIVRQGWVLLALSFLVGLAVTWWLARSIERLNRYATALAAGERTAAPAVGGGELGELGLALATMRDRLDGKQYVEDYVHAMAHEMKSPLAAIRGAAEILDDPSVSSDDRQRFVHNIEAQSRRMAAMIDRMLALAAVEYRQALEDPRPVSLQDVSEEAIGQVTARAEAAGVIVEWADVGDAVAGGSVVGRAAAGGPASPRAPAHAPARAQGAPRAIVSGDPFLLRQAITNLVENAVDFSPRGARVQVAMELMDGLVSVRIVDNGTGIPDYAQARVFERFYSLPRPDGARSSGLGLGFVREVAALHGGSVTLDNRAEGGAVALLHLPVAR